MWRFCYTILVISCRGQLFKYRRIDDPVDRYQHIFFPPLKNELFINEVGIREPEATSMYPWLARVIFSYYYSEPTLCTAACIAPGVFVTSARCAYGLTPGVASIRYSGVSLKSVAIILTDKDKTTKQYFDEIGFIVTEKQNLKGYWPTLNPFNGPNRSDDAFHWFDKMNLEEGEMEHVAYAFNEISANMIDPNQANVTLQELYPALFRVNVYVGIRFCEKIFPLKGRKRGFFVPCFFTCNYDEYVSGKWSEACKNFLRMDGAVVANIRDSSLVGIATWGLEDVMSRNRPLPVGIAIPNSETYWENYECAIVISRNIRNEPPPGYYQSLCSENKRTDLVY